MKLNVSDSDAVAHAPPPDSTKRPCHRQQSSVRAPSPNERTMLAHLLGWCSRTEPRRVFRRLSCVSHAASAVCSVWRLNAASASAGGRLGCVAVRWGWVLDGCGGAALSSAPAGRASRRAWKAGWEDKSLTGRRGEDRRPVGRTDFKSDGTRETCPVGSTPTLFRHYPAT